MKKVATVTFHRAQNFGSVLQTYALQQFVQWVGAARGEKIEYCVVDVQPRMQAELYNIYKKGFSITNFIKNSVAFLYCKKLKTKQKKFQQFLSEYIHLSKEYKTVERLYENVPAYDYFISGSDQIWNVRSCDFEDYFYLDFVKSAKKISYAASFGPLKIDWSQYDADKYASLLKEYAYISTREEGSAENVLKLTEKQPEIHVDPTLLLDREEWRKIQSKSNYKDGKYILMYCLEPTKEQLRIVKSISKKLRLPIVITRYNNKNDIVNGFVKKYDAGPCDFLSLIDNAALVITSSFHGTAFSLIYRKTFYVLHGKTDNRISDILEKTGLLERSIECIADVEKVNLQNINFFQAEEFLEEQKQRSRDYLKLALDL